MSIEEEAAILSPFRKRAENGEIIEEDVVEENQPKVLSTFEICNDAYISYMEGMQRVIYNNLGTARKLFNGFNDEEHTFPSDIRVCAKTGTAQHGSGGSDNASLLVFAPADDPQIAIAVYGEHAGQGGNLSVVSKAIMEVYFADSEASDVEAVENRVS